MKTKRKTEIRNHRSGRLHGGVAKLSLLAMALVPTALLAEEKDSLAKLRQETDVLWMMLAAFLVFLMQAGFAYVEAGFTRARNTVNILMKNIGDFCLSSIGFWFFGFSLMFALPLFEGFGVGTPQTALGLLETGEGPDTAKYGFFFFQLVFAGTAATIASGAMAERTHFVAYLVGSFFVSAVIYPVFGSLAWADLFGSPAGFLSDKGFIDFAGSTVVHSTGAWVGLAGAIVLGPREGKFGAKGEVKPIFGQNMAMSALGVFLLWFGWFGFNPGSTTAVGGGDFAYIAVTTNFAAVGGAMGAMILSWIMFRRPDISMTLNGVLGGLVAITAPCANVSVTSALIIGFVAGLLVVGGVVFLDHLRIDDPVGAVAVHGMAGAWGTLAAGLFAQSRYGGGPDGLFFGGGFDALGVQALGVGINFVWAFGAGLVLFWALDKVLTLRVSADAELEGLDILEHGNQAYWQD